MDKVLFFIPSLYNSAGMERISTDLVNLLRACGVGADFCVLSARSDSFFPLCAGVAVHSLGGTGRVRSQRWLMARRLRRVIRQGGYRTLVNVDVAMVQVAALALPQTLGCRVVSWEQFSMATARGAAWLKRLFTVCFSCSTVVLTQADRRSYPAWARRRVEVIPNFTNINPSGRRADMGQRRVLAAGRLCREKGFDLLLEAWARVAARHSGWELCIAGAGADRAALEAQAARLGLKGSVRLLGVVRSMSEAYLSASLFVLSSRHESFGLVLIEAKSFGLPVVSFDCPFGPREIVADGTDGLIVAGGDVGALADALSALMASGERRAAMSAEAVADYERRWSRERVLSRWCKLLGINEITPP